MARTILVIDDENNMRWVLDRALQKAGYEVVTASRGDEGLRLFARYAVDLVLLDLKMPGMDGLSVLRELRQRNRQIPVLLLTAYATVPTAVEALKIGAIDYVRKPFDLEELQTKISYALYTSNPSFSGSTDSSSTTEPTFVGISLAIARIHSLVEAASTNDYPVLIYGETGSGRRTVARLIHQRNAAASEVNMVLIDCDALPESVLESELGHLLHDAKSEVTQSQKGDMERWEQALGGTFILANFDRLPFDWADRFQHNIQPYLRSPQRPHGLRLVLTSQKVLDKQWSNLSNQFITIETPPLRNHPEDIPLLIAHFAPHLDWNAAARQALNSYNWPGNVAELQQILSYAATLSNGQSVELDHLPPSLSLQPLSSESSQTGPQIELPKEGIDLDQIEKNLIKQALDRADNKTQAARLLNISRSTLLYRLAKHGLSDDGSN
ncbi:sigma-54 dependent transcriptional regulator [Chloroflexi bacterium TSY]|nr:sigma-54 dependent transcriptional regulator [Chloroflexi bacterium TSY]